MARAQVALRSTSPDPELERRQGDKAETMWVQSSAPAVSLQGPGLIHGGRVSSSNVGANLPGPGHWGAMRTLAPNLGRAGAGNQV